jgi:hypothetical protein
VRTIPAAFAIMAAVETVLLAAVLGVKMRRRIAASAVQAAPSLV